jgi:hypothetical protein
MRSGLYHEAKCRKCLQKQQEGYENLSPRLIDCGNSRYADHDKNQKREISPANFPYSACNLSSARLGENKRMMNGCFVSNPRQKFPD